MKTQIKKNIQKKEMKIFEWKFRECMDTCGENGRMANKSRHTAPVEEIAGRHSSWARNLNAGDRFSSTHYQKAREKGRIWGSKEIGWGVDQAFDEMRMCL